MNFEYRLVSLIITNQITLYMGNKYFVCSINTQLYATKLRLFIIQNVISMFVRGKFWLLIPFPKSLVQLCWVSFDICLDILRYVFVTLSSYMYLFSYLFCSTFPFRILINHQFTHPLSTLHLIYMYLSSYMYLSDILSSYMYLSNKKSWFESIFLGVKHWPKS